MAFYINSFYSKEEVKNEMKRIKMNQKLIDQVLAQIKIDMKYGDMTAIAELIETLATEQTSRQVLNDYIGEESQ